GGAPPPPPPPPPTLYGLVHLQWQQDRAQYLIAWWSEGSGINANLAVLMTPQTQGWQLLRDEDDDPASITPLLTTMRPLQFKGYLPQAAFSNAVRMLIEHSLMPEGGKGILVALRPVPGLAAEQALTLCQLRCFGDVVTVAQQRLFIYLSTCRPNELETALKSIFRLPVNEIFSNRLVWSQDVQMLIEVKSLSEAREESVVSSTVQSVVLPREERPASVPIRREPIALALFEESSEGKIP
ncbi:MAG: BcsE family c-di-GMP-binding protein, partial [Symbiopectobacterium sp.]|uniref:BcsE family c-di-GMP-binding protein n=1 Tax=Symbiopectobacterium sp. TaxID=2952789 RepID=UPI0039E8DD6F